MCSSQDDPKRYSSLAALLSFCSFLVRWDEAGSSCSSPSPCAHPGRGKVGGAAPGAEWQPAVVASGGLGVGPSPTRPPCSMSETATGWHARRDQLPPLCLEMSGARSIA